MKPYKVSHGERDGRVCVCLAPRLTKRLRIVALTGLFIGCGFDVPAPSPFQAQGIDAALSADMSTITSSDDDAGREPSDLGGTVDTVDLSSESQDLDSTLDATPSLDAGVLSATDGSTPFNSDLGYADTGPVDAQLPEDWYDPQWRSRTRIRLLAQSVARDFDNAVVRLNLNRSHHDFGETRLDGADLLFVDPNGRVINHWVESWSADGGLVWLKVPTLRAHRVDQAFWMYTQNPLAEQPASVPVWSQQYSVVLRRRNGGDNLINAVNELPIGRNMMGRRPQLNLSNDYGMVIEFTGDELLPVQLEGLENQDGICLELSYRQQGAGPGLLAGLLGGVGTPSVALQTDETGALYLGYLRALDGSTQRVILPGQENRWRHVVLCIDFANSYLRYVVDGQRGLIELEPATLVGLEPGVVFGASWNGELSDVRIALTSKALDVMAILETLRRQRVHFEMNERPVHPPSPPARGERVTGSVIDFSFDELLDPLVAVVGLNGQPVHLDISDIDAVEDLGGGIRLNRSTRLVSPEFPQVLLDECVQSNQLTIDVWIALETTHLEGPARLVSVSKNTMERLFTLGQEPRQDNLRGTSLVFRLRHSNTDPNGVLHNSGMEAPLTIPLDEDGTNTVQHIAFTFDGTTLKGFLNGQEVSSANWPGQFSAWSELATSGALDTYRLVLGNENTLGRALVYELRPWLGSLYHLSLYCRALTNDEVQMNFAAGF